MLNAAARTIIPALLSEHVSRIAYPSAEAIARRQRIGSRFNASPHEHRDKHTGTFMRSEGLPSGWYQARARLEADQRAILSGEHETR